MENKKRILVIAPHADDEILGCGATIARHVSEGARVQIAILTNASEGSPELFSKDYIARLRKEALMAHEMLGVEKTIFRELPAPKLDQLSVSDVSQVISEIIELFKPNRIYIPFENDLHNDHKIIFQSCLVAARPLPESKIEKILAYETLSETEWAAPFPQNAFVPNYYINIEHFLETKIQAFELFESQIKQFPHPRSSKTIEALARFRGSTVGYAAAESFMLIRQIEA